MRDPKKRAISNACHWLNKCYDLGITTGEIIAISTASHEAASQKENGEGKRELPPAPPIEKREEAKEKTTATTTARARARGRKSEIFPPTVEMVYAECEAEKIPHLYGDYFMDRQKKESWRHPTSGKRMTSWRKALRVWWDREGTFPGRSSWESYQSDHKTEERSERRYDIFGEGEQ